MMKSLNIGFELSGMANNGGDYSISTNKRIIITGGFCQISMVPLAPITPGNFAAVFLTVSVYPNPGDGPFYQGEAQQFCNYLTNPDFDAPVLNNPHNLVLAGPDWSSTGCFIKAILKTTGAESNVVIPRSGLKWEVNPGGTIVMHMDQAYTGSEPIPCDCEMQGVVDYA